MLSQFISLLQCLILVISLSDAFTFSKLKAKNEILVHPLSSSLSQYDDTKDNQQQEQKIQLGSWIPIGSRSALIDILPIKIEMMGRDFVVWKKTKEEVWSVMEDVCPHRLAPLSRGRINEETDCIACGYHGWEFNEVGDITKIPQLEERKDLSKINTMGGSCATFTTHLTGDLIWAFFPTEMHGESFPITLLPEQLYYPNLEMDMLRNATYYTHEFPASFHMVMENGLDPAHFCFAHNGVISRREDAAPMSDMKVVTSNFTHLDVYTTYKRYGEPRERLYSFQRPSLLYTQERTTTTPADDTPAVDSTKTTTATSSDIGWKPGSLFFIVPVREGHTRIITSVAKLTKSFVPDWITHLATKQLFDGDYVIHGSEIVLHQKKNHEGKKYNYVEPTNSDVCPRAWNQWMKKYGFEKAPPHSFARASPSSLSTMSMREMINPWRVHTSQCSKCQKVLRRARKTQVWSIILGVLCGAVLQEKRKSPILGALTFCIGIASSFIAKKLVVALEGSHHPSDVIERSYSQL